MNKPKPEVPAPALNYFDCRDYINKKYDINMDNYANKTYGGGTGDNDDVPYLNFWHVLLNSGNDMSNGCYFEMFLGEPSEYYYKAYKDELWAQDVYKLFKKEFSEYVDEEDFLRFWVEW